MRVHLKGICGDFILYEKFSREWFIDRKWKLFESVPDQSEQRRINRINILETSGQYKNQTHFNLFLSLGFCR